ncbi:hypothetical protein D3C81_07270 [compost metagenome]
MFEFVREGMHNNFLMHNFRLTPYKGVVVRDITNEVWCNTKVNKAVSLGQRYKDDAIEVNLFELAYYLTKGYTVIYVCDEEEEIVVDRLLNALEVTIDVSNLKCISKRTEKYHLYAYVNSFKGVQNVVVISDNFNIGDTLEIRHIAIKDNLLYYYNFKFIEIIQMLMSRGNFNTTFVKELGKSYGVEVAIEVHNSNDEWVVFVAYKEGKEKLKTIIETDIVKVF